MFKTMIAVVFGAILGAGGLSLAGHDERDEDDNATVRVIAERDILEKLDGEAAKVSMIEVTHAPGAAGKPHRHSGPIFGYILEGEYELGLDDKPAKTLKVGETFYEPKGALHRVGRNPDPKKPTRVLAVLLHSRDGAPPTVLEPSAK
ncbi:cupin domain-containing protein [Isosphaeraceae bacterium EP7]